MGIGRLLRACVVTLAVVAAVASVRPALAQANFDRPGGDYQSAPVTSGTYAGTPILIPMTGWDSAAPVGLSTPATTAPEFNAFVLVTP